MQAGGFCFLVRLSGSYAFVAVLRRESLRVSTKVDELNLCDRSRCQFLRSAERSSETARQMTHHGVVSRPTAPMRALGR